jgi:hypothetical protein
MPQNVVPCYDAKFSNLLKTISRDQHTVFCATNLN